MIQAE